MAFAVFGVFLDFCSFRLGYFFCLARFCNFYSIAFGAVDFVHETLNLLVCGSLGIHRHTDVSDAQFFGSFFFVVRHLSRVAKIENGCDAHLFDLLQSFFGRFAASVEIWVDLVKVWQVLFGFDCFGRLNRVRAFGGDGSGRIGGVSAYTCQT